MHDLSLWTYKMCMSPADPCRFSSSVYPIASCQCFVEDLSRVLVAPQRVPSFGCGALNAVEKSMEHPSIQPSEELSELACLSLEGITTVTITPIRI